MSESTAPDRTSSIFSAVVYQASTEPRPPPAPKTELGTQDRNHSSSCTILAEAQNAIHHRKNTQRTLTQRSSITISLGDHSNIGTKQTLRPDTSLLDLRKGHQTKALAEPSTLSSPNHPNSQQWHFYDVQPQQAFHQSTQVMIPQEAKAATRLLQERTPQGPLPRATKIGKPSFSEFLISAGWISKDPETTSSQMWLTLKKWRRGH